MLVPRTSHGPEHDEHHVGSRRAFMRQLGLLTTGAALLPGTSLAALGSSALVQALVDSPGDRILVLVRLKGGNDGLNTVVPLYDYDAYRRARPRLAYAPAETLSLTPELALAPTMGPALDLWREGAMRIVNGVGYADASLSHFRGTDIVASASGAREVWSSGWLGRHLDACFPDFLTAPPAAPPAIQIGGAGSLLFDNEAGVSLSVTVNDAEELAELAQRGELYPVDDLPACLYGEQLGYLRGVANSTFTFAGGIERAFAAGRNEVSYPAGALGRQLAMVARLVKGGLGTRMYLVTLDGFDTHAAQRAAHGALVGELAGSTAAFYADLARAGLERRALTATFSEFGRRIDENASGGTDHGTAAPQMLFSPAFDGSAAVGAAPSLTSPDPNGNLAFTTDFRRVYATLLERWLCLAPAAVDNILGGSFERVDLGIDCTSVGLSPERGGARALGAALARVGGGAWELRWESAEASVYTLTVVDLAGRVLARAQDRLPAGACRMSLPSGGELHASGAYGYRLVDARGRVSGGLVPFLR